MNYIGIYKKKLLKITEKNKKKNNVKIIRNAKKNWHRCG